MRKFTEEELDSIKEILVRKTKTPTQKESITESTRLWDDLGLDSLSVVEVAMDIEIKLQTGVSDSELDCNSTFENLLKTIR